MTAGRTPGAGADGILDGAPGAAGGCRRRLLALVKFRNEENYLPDLLANLRGQVEGIVALDDGSTDRSLEIMVTDPLVLEVLPPEPWSGFHDGRLHRRLTRAAWEHAPDWLLGIDADERVEAEFRVRAESVLDWAETHGHRALALAIREVWDDPRLVRVDGLFGRKQRVSLFRARRDHVFDDRPLHGHWGPVDDAGRGFPRVDLILYHLRMLRDVDRRARRLKYERIDPGARHQPLGYAYLTSLGGLQLQPVEPDRSYQPLPEPSRLPVDPLATLAPPPPGPSIAVVLRCHRDPGLVAAIVELVRDAVDEVVVVADERMSPQELGVIAAARPTAIHRIPHLQPNERGNAFAQSLCSSAWLLRLCGDELPSLALLSDLRRLVADERMTNYRVPIAWLWPGADRRLDRRPWWPDYQPRLLRNDPALFHYPGTTHGGLDVEGACRLLEAPILHLDLLISSEAERLEKIARYEAERPGLVSAGLPLNRTIYLPEAAGIDPTTAPIEPREAAMVAAALARRSDGTATAEPLLLPICDIYAVDARWNARPWPEEAYRAHLEPAYGERGLQLVAGRDVVHVAVENLGTEIWPGALASSPQVRVGYRLRSAEGELLAGEGVRSPFPSPVRPGERVIVPVAIDTPRLGRFVIECALVHENVRWFGEPLRIPITVRPAQAPTRVTGGAIAPRAPAAPPLACVVMSLGNEPSLAEAVRSVLAQGGGAVELVVVNSGGGDAADTLARAGLAVPLVERQERLNPGAVRNLGIAATHAPFVSFLAADCLAAPGWVEGRRHRHLSGASAVASSLLHTSARNPFAWAMHVALYARRMPGAPPERRLLYGVSYARDLFDRFGLFPEELRAGEDTAFNQRLAGIVDIEWAPEVQTRHRHPRRLGELVRDQFGRGARAAAAWAILGGRRRAYVAADAFRRLPSCLGTAWRAAERAQRPWISAAVPLLPVAAAAYAAGALFGGRGGRGGTS